jgi:hypothetical protein
VKYLIVAALLVLPDSLIAETVELALENKSARVELEVERFAEAKHRMQYREIEDSGQKYRVLEKIDGREFSGTDGSIPTVEILKFRLLTGSECFEVPIDSFGSLFEPGLESKVFRSDAKFERDPSGSGLELQFWFKDGRGLLSWRGGDGAGAYTVTWEFHLDTLSVKRFLTQFPDPDTPEISTFKLKKC